MSVFRGVEATVTDIDCNSTSGLGIGDEVVEHNKTNEDEEIMSYFKGWYLYMC